MLNQHVLRCLQREYLAVISPLIAVPADSQFALAPILQMDDTQMADQLNLLEPGHVHVHNGRPDDDFYETPFWLAYVGIKLLGELPPNPQILDPGAGTGMLGTVAKQFYPGAVVTAVEKDAERLAMNKSADVKHCGDFIEWKRQQINLFCYDAVVLNPPFKVDGEGVWCKWVDQCFDLARPARGKILVLGHGLLWTTPARHAWFERRMPTMWGISSKRPSFTGDGGNDGRVWGWWLWDFAKEAQLRRTTDGWRRDNVTELRLLPVEW